MNNEEMMKIDGGGDGIDAFVGTMGAAWCIPAGLAVAALGHQQ